MAILLADDHGLYRESIKQWLKVSDKGYQVVTVGDYAQVLSFLEDSPLPDLLMLDLCMPSMQGVMSVRELHKQYPALPILVVSANHHPLTIQLCMEAGAVGYLPKACDGASMLQAIARVMMGEVYMHEELAPERRLDFSDKQLRILFLLAEGYSNKEISEKIYLTEGTVKQYVSKILSKLHVSNRVQACLHARDILGLGR